MASDLFGSLFGSAGLPFLKSTSPSLPFQDVLFNAFQNRQSIFSPSPTSGTPGASAATPFHQQLSGGGLAWSYDPKWMTGLPKPAPIPMQSSPSAPVTLAEVLTRRRQPVPDPYPPLTDPDEWEERTGSRVPFLPRKPENPAGRTGEWRWSNGQWVWIDTGPHELPSNVPGYKRDILSPY